jgi:hypothetical protein
MRAAELRAILESQISRAAQASILASENTRDHPFRKYALEATGAVRSLRFPA